MDLILNNLPWFVLFIGVLLFVEAIYFLIADLRHGQARAVNRRMRALQSSRANSGVLGHQLLRSQRTGMTRALGGALPPLERLIDQAGAPISIGRVILAMAGLTTALFLLLGLVIVMPWPIALGVAFLVGSGLPVVVLVIFRRKRLKRFHEQLPDILNLMARSLKAGHPVSVMMGTVAEEMDDPAGTEFGLAVDEMTYGLTLHEALDNMTHRISLDDLKFVVVAIQIQHQVGGNLAELITNIEDVVRDRFRMVAKIRAVSAEGRVSAWVIGFMPLFVWGAIMLLNPKYYVDVNQDPLFSLLVGIGVALLFVGHFVLWRLVNFRF